MPVAIPASGGMERRTSSSAAARPPTPLASSARRDVRCHRDDHRPVRERSKSTALTRGSVLAECGATRGPPRRAQPHEVRSVSFELAWVATALYPRPCRDRAPPARRAAGRSDTHRDRLTCACRSAGDGSGPRFRDLQRSQGGLPQVLPGVDARTGYMSWASRCGERRWSGRRNRTCATSFRAPALWVDE